MTEKSFVPTKVGIEIKRLCFPQRIRRGGKAFMPLLIKKIAFFGLNYF